MIKNNFYRSKFDNCVYYKECLGRIMIYLLLYVDDILISCESLDEIDKLKQKLNGEFDMKNLGPAKRILGMDIRRERKLKKLFLTQEIYLKKLLSKFGMMES